MKKLHLSTLKCMTEGPRVSGSVCQVEREEVQADIIEVFIQWDLIGERLKQYCCPGHSVARWEM